MVPEWCYIATAAYAFGLTVCVNLYMGGTREQSIAAGRTYLTGIATCAVVMAVYALFH